MEIKKTPPAPTAATADSPDGNARRRSIGQLYFLCVTLGGAATAALTLIRGPLGVVADLAFWILAAIGFVAELITVPLPKGGRLTASFAVLFAGLILLGPQAVVLYCALNAFLGGWLVQRRPLALCWFNFSQYTLSYLAASLVLQQGGWRPGAVELSGLGISLAAAALSYLVLNVLLVNGYIAIAKHIPLHRVLWEDDRWELIFTLVQAPVATVLVLQYRLHGWLGAALVLVPLIVSTVLLILLVRVHQARIKLSSSLKELAAANASLDAANSELRLLHAVTRRIVSPTDLNETLRLLALEIQAVIHCDQVLVFLVEKESGRLALQKTCNEAPVLEAELAPYEGIVARACAEFRPVSVRDLEDAGEETITAVRAYRSLLAVPIVGDRGAEGTILALARQPAAFDHRHEDVLTTLASFATFAIRNAQLLQATQLLAITDGLTAVYNRRYFQRQLESELRRASRYGYPISLILLDIDHFKQFNDSNGHLLGDQVVRAVAQLTRESVRETDVVARYGGEEFAVILPETPLEVALSVGQRISSRIKQHTFWGKGQKPVTITASLGIATHTSSQTKAEALVDRADRALYLAKNLGRDRLCAWTEADLEPSDRTVANVVKPARRLPGRQKLGMDITAWRAYLLEGADQLSEALGARIAGLSVIEPPAEGWRPWVEQLLGAVGECLAKPETEPPEQTILAQLRAEVGRWIAHGLTLTMGENLVLGTCNDLNCHVRVAPFAPQEQLVVLAAVERFTQRLQLAVASYWHESYQQANRHLLVVQELEDRLRQGYDLDEFLTEATRRLTAATSADGAIVYLSSGRDIGSANGSLSVRFVCGQLESEDMNQELASCAFALLEPRIASRQPMDTKMPEAGGPGAALAVPLARQGLAFGALELLWRQPREIVPQVVRLVQSIAGQVGAAVDRLFLEESRQDAYLGAIGELIAAMEAKDRFAVGHHESLTNLATAIGQALDLDAAALLALEQAGRFHDLGKIAVPDEILLKPGALDSQERLAVEVHPEIGARILSPLSALSQAIPAILHHHEYWNGSGYPKGLKGDEIPLLARILAVAEAWEGMTTPKAYRPAIDPQKALNEMQGSGQFDPKVLEALARLEFPLGAAG